MTFIKGQSGNPSGKPIGTKNKASAQLRQMIEGFLTDNFQTIQSDFNNLPAKDRAKLYCDLLQYGLPKLQAISTDLEFERLTDEQLNEIVTKLRAI
ncbi:MAG: DUF5681 domain-containing protein [Bacteroidota bacterium]